MKSQYNGLVKRLIGFVGRIREERTHFTGQIESQETPPKAKIYPIIPFKAVLHGKFFHGVIRRLDAVFRMIFSTVRMALKSKSKADKAPADEIKADAGSPPAVETQLITKPAETNTAKRGIVLGVLVRAAAIARAAITFIVQLPLHRTTRLDKARGVVIPRYEEVIQQERISKAGAADGVITESRFNVIDHAYEAPAIAAEAKLLDADVAFTDAAPVKVNATADILPLDVDVDIFASHSVKIAYWIEPDLQDGDLLLRQSYAASAASDTMEVA